MVLWCLTPLSTIFQLYRGSQFYWLRKPEYPVKTRNFIQTVNNTQIIINIPVSKCYNKLNSCFILKIILIKLCKINIDNLIVNSNVDLTGQLDHDIHCLEDVKISSEWPKCFDCSINKWNLTGGQWATTCYLKACCLLGLTYQISRPKWRILIMKVFVLFLIFGLACKLSFIYIYIYIFILINQHGIQINNILLTIFTLYMHSLVAFDFSKLEEHTPLFRMTTNLHNFWRSCLFLDVIISLNFKVLGLFLSFSLIYNFLWLSKLSHENK